MGKPLFFASRHIIRHRTIPDKALFGRYTAHKQAGTKTQSAKQRKTLQRIYQDGPHEVLYQDTP